MSYLNRFLQFPVLSTISATSLPEFRRSSDVVAVGYIAAEDDRSKEKFGLLAQRMHPEYVFGVTDDSALADLERIDIPGIAVYKVADGETNTLPLIDDMDDMIDNLRMTARPLIVDLAHELHEGLLDVS
jgi:protein disulfide-isomerase A1